MQDRHSHHTHPQIGKRLRRAEGHLRAIQVMIEEGRSCADIAQQLHAVHQAIVQAKRMVIQDHLDHCFDDVIGTLPPKKRGPIEEFRDITKYL
jgi:uncharacterized protein